MWIFCKLGFFSAVQHREHPENLLIRARFKGDLERLLNAMTPEEYALCGRPSVSFTPDADYRYRVEIRKVVFAELIREQAEEIDYDNFKNAAHDGTVRDGAYMDVWRALWAAQNFGKNRAKVL
jgi:hypothetical protein